MKKSLRKKTRKLLKRIVRYVKKTIVYILEILDPQRSVGNLVFLVLCLIAISSDSLFFFIPVINDDKKCYTLDKELGIWAVVLRSIIDSLYITSTILQLRTDSHKNSKKCSRLCLFFFIDIFAILPLPQILVISAINQTMRSKYFYPAISIIVFQHVARVIRMCTRMYTLLTKAKVSGNFADKFALAAFRLSYFYPGQVLGALWYFLAIAREIHCWKLSCINHTGCTRGSFYCAESSGNYTFLNYFCHVKSQNTIVYDFGMFYDALQSHVVEMTSSSQKLVYCFRWGLQHLSYLGQGLQPSTDVWENIFVIFVTIVGVLLLVILIADVQTYLQSATTRLDDMRVKRRDAEDWMVHRLLPECMRERIKRCDQYKWVETRGFDEDNLLHNLPKDLRRGVKRHLCWPLVMKVPIFAKMDENVLDAMCDRLRRVLYTEESYIIREGDPVDEMFFITRGNLLSFTINGGALGFIYTIHLKAGDFCAEEVLAWALDRRSSNKLPVSPRSVRALTQVEAFALTADDLKYVASQFRLFSNEQLMNTFRRSSHQYRFRAVCFIQAIWRRHIRRLAQEEAALFMRLTQEDAEIDSENIE